MVDLVGIGVSGLTAYQQALATTSNNIANMQTDGYVRQRVSLQPAGQDNLSRISLGNGVRFAGIERLYDQFAEENLQSATSDLKGQEALLTQLQSLQDAIGSSESGLHGAMQEFFDSARALEAAPGAAGTRAGFLAAADGVTARMRNLGSTVQSLETSSRTQVEQEVAELNSYLQEIAQLNSELLKRTNSADQPMQLLDRRDATLKKIAGLMGVTVKLSSGGAATIYAGDSAAGVALVENSKTHVISAQFDKADYGRVQFVLDASSRPTVLPTVRNGSLGGLVTFRSQSLGVAADTLDAIALGFGRAVNKTHHDGLDAQGDPGGDLFYVGPNFEVDGKANAGTARLGVEVLNPDVVQARSYKMTFDATAREWTVIDQATGESATGANDLLLGGLKFSLQGEPKNGDSFTISPETRPALTFQTLIRDPEKVATASKGTVSSSPTNSSTASGGISFGTARPTTIIRSLQETLPRTSGPPYRDTIFSKSSRPIAVIPAGTANVALSVAPDGGELAIFTRDGRQLSGPDLTPLHNQILTESNGFVAGAQYSAVYRNKIGADAYLDHGFVSGAYAVAGSQEGAGGTRVWTPATIVADPIDVETIPQNFTLQVNGHAIDIDLSNVTHPSDSAEVLAAIRDQVNAAQTSTRVVAELGVNDNLIFKSAQSVTADIPVTPGAYVDINGTRFEGDDADALATAINDAHIGVVATTVGVGANATIRVTNGEGQGGRPFTLGGPLFDAKTYFNDAPVSVEVSSDTVSSALSALGVRRGFAMSDALGEDLLVFGVTTDAAGDNPTFSAVSLSGSFDAVATVADEFGPGKTPDYSVVFGDANSYSIVDANTNTEVCVGTLDQQQRTIAYGNWTITFDGIPSKGDAYSVNKTDAPLGDNRVAAAMARLQSRRDLTGNDQTLQEEYESLVNKTGALTVQAEIGKNAQQVVFNHATEARDRVSGVNLDEELADLLRYQQAYQANAQIVQTASKLFDALMQRL